jgi:cation transport protein ChaC
MENQMPDPTSEFALADPMPPAIAALRNTAEPVWIFAYGSLMWDEDFPRAETETALLRGYHRSFCLYSYDYRGTRTRPGLTLGLDRGGACRGSRCACRSPGSARRSIACGRAR